MYLNFTHIGIMNRIDDFYKKYGVMERLHGDIYVAQAPFKQIELERYAWINFFFFIIKYNEFS